MLSVLFNFFYIPFRNWIEMLDILKDHSSLLTILLCITIIGSSAIAFNTLMTNIMSGLLFIIILYKVVKN